MRMKTRMRRFLAAGFVAGLSTWADAQEIWPQNDSGLAFRGGELRLVSRKQVEPSPEQPVDTGAPATTPMDEGGAERFTSTESPSPPVETTNPLTERENLPAIEQNSTPAIESVSTSERQLLGDADLGAILNDSSSVQTVQAQQRSPIAFDPRVRGYHIGQIYTQADGEYWLPVRNDLDSMLSRIDPGLIQNIVVVPGPYGLRYGPGFSFIDVVTMDTPRYDCFEAHNRIGVTSRFNGGQLFGYETVYGGNADYGFIFSYGNRTGADYLTGNNLRIPSSYHSQNFLGQFGFDLDECSRFEFRYNRLDQTDTETALQFFDVNNLASDSFSGSFIRDDECNCSVFRMDGWYNRTRFAGDTRGAGKGPVAANPDLHVIDRVRAALATAVRSNPANISFAGDTNGDLISTGARAVKTIGDDGDTQLRMGADARYVEQHTLEQFEALDNGTPIPISPFSTNQPRSSMIDPGLFTELSVPWQSFQTITVGGRVDWVGTTAQKDGGLPDGFRGQNLGSSLNPADFHQDDVLYAFYLTDDVELSENWGTRIGFGQAQRVPTLTERYADGVFLGIFQSGFSRIIGNPLLRKERNWQIDWSVNADYEAVRGRASFFHSWVQDYITYGANPVNDPTGAFLLTATNTPHATLAGCEMYSELDLTDRLRAFGTIQYVDGRDRTLGAPLPGIYPLSSRVGLQLRDLAPQQAWGAEIGTQMANAQNRLGGLRVASTNNIQTVETQTPGYATWYVRAFYNFTQNAHMVVGVDNLFDRTYFEHLNLRLGRPNDPQGFPVSTVFSPGITPYMTFELTF